MSRPLRPSPTCLNCGEPVATRFCSACGQENTDYRVSLGRLLGDLAEEVFQLESRLWRTLWTLFRRPGLLTREYNAGRRVAYTTPLRLYLTASVAYFFVAGVMPDHGGKNVKFDFGEVTAADKAELAKAPPYLRGFMQRVRDAQKDPQGTAARVRQTLSEWAPRIAAGLVPILALLTWLFFRRPKRYFVEHLVFALHAHATAFFLLLVATVLPVAIVGFAAFVAGVVVMFLAMRRMFEQSRLRTALKLATIGFVYSIFLGLGIGGVALLGFLSRS